MAAAETAAERERRWTRGVSIAGVAFAVLFIVGMLMAGATPEYDAPAQEWADWYADSGNRQGQVISALLMVLSALTLLVFVAGIYRLLRAANADRHGWPLVALAAGIVLSVLIIVGTLAISNVSTAIEFAPSDFAVPGADVAQVMEQLGFGVLLLGGGWSAALLVAAASLSARETALFPSWLATTGLVLAVILLGSVAFIPFVALPIWVLLVCFMGLGRTPAAD